MKKTRYLLVAMGCSLLSWSCFDAEDTNFTELSPITFNEVGSTISVALGDELIYDKLVVKSDKPVIYEWAYGKIKPGTSDPTAMQSLKVISDKPDVRHVFERIGSYVLRLRADNGESIIYKYFTLNVNSGLDEGLLLLTNDAAGNGDLTFIKKRSAEEIEANAQEIYPDIFSLINPQFALKNATSMYLSFYQIREAEYSSLLISTDDATGSIYKLEPKTFELYATNHLKDEYGTSCVGFAGDIGSSAAHYVFMQGKDGGTYRYDLYGDFLGSRPDAIAAGKVTHSTMLVYRSKVENAADRKPVLYNQTTLFQPGSGKVTMRSLAGFNIINLCALNVGSKTYVLFQSQADPKIYCIQSTTASLGTLAKVTDFTTDKLYMDENSVMVNTKNSKDAYYSFENKVYRWSLTAEPARSPTITLPAGEIIRDMTTNYMGDFGNGEDDETLLYVATYNPNRAGELKGSIYIYQFKDDSLIKKYEGVCNDPVRIMYKYRIS